MERCQKEPKPHGMCYSHFGNEVCSGAISIRQQGFINNPRWLMGKNSGNSNGVCRSLGAKFDFLSQISV